MNSLTPAHPAGTLSQDATPGLFSTALFASLS